MYRVQVMNKIAPAGLRRLDPGRYQVSKEETRYEGLILRSADLHGFDFPDELLAIARAGSGTNNIPIDQCNARGIAVFNTPGANANAVKELLIADLLLASRDLLGGIQWVRQQVADGVDVTKVVEKGKAAFVGPELVGKTLGIIGLGAIGAKAANAAINLARGGLVSDDAIIDGLESGRVAKYITDFPDNHLVQTKNVVAMPHLGASTPESETNCAIMAADELRDYLENGNITNSVNLPDLTMRRSGDCRICVIHKNVPTVLSSIVKLFSDLEINVENLINKSKKELAYTMIDIDRKVGDAMIEAIEGLDNIIRVRILK